jgi:hypothetical protein
LRLCWHNKNRPLLLGRHFCYDTNFAVIADKGGGFTDSCKIKDGRMADRRGAQLSDTGQMRIPTFLKASTITQKIILQNFTGDTLKMKA